ncbi:MAG TPA: 23S rRNA (adenine(2503)-C(2))-methyltransferase RlmN [Pantanalinema sp.]
MSAEAPWLRYLHDKARRAGLNRAEAILEAHAMRAHQGRELYRALTRDAAPDPFSPLEAITIQEAEDGQTIKALLKLHDGLSIETVLMQHHGRRNTVCVSSQAGCAYRCAFCATGQAGFSRHLTPSEILDQVLYFARHLQARGERITNIVFMGMGEPFHNYHAVCAAIAMLCDQSGMSLARRHVTLSTVGLVPEIRKFAREPVAVNLAISLHAPNDAIRSALMPVNDRYPLDELMEACADYAQTTGRRIFFEYLMLEGVNDGDTEAEALATLMRRGDYHLNLIPYNTTPDAALQGSADERVRAFQAILTGHGVPTTVRQPMGRDIAAACGQLQAETQPRAK